MNTISQYARNIAVFLIFISFLGIIMPSEKYRKYINLVSGFVLMIIVIVPIGQIISADSISIDGIYSDMEIKLNKNIIEKEKDYYEEMKLGLVIEAYKNDIELQIENIISAKGYTTQWLYIEVNEGSEAFGTIQYIEAVVSKKDNSVKKNSLIHIDTIAIGPAVSSAGKAESDETEKYEESSEIKNLKNYFSDFYNLSVDNIYIKEQMNTG